MNRFAKMSLAVAALSLIVLSAAPVSAAEIVISLRGKTAEQVSAEIQVAALKVCRAESARTPLSLLVACTADVAQDAMNQIPASPAR